MFFFILFKQKTAYELRISDWSSDVCSSDLAFAGPDGDVRLSGGAPVDSELRWRSGSLQGIEFGAATLPWRSAGAALRSRATVVVPMLGGQVRFDDIVLQPPAGGEGLRIRFGLALQEIGRASCRGSGGRYG